MPKTLVQQIVDTVARLMPPPPPLVSQALVQPDGRLLFAGETVPQPPGIPHGSMPGEWVTVLRANGRAYVLGVPSLDSGWVPLPWAAGFTTGSHPLRIRRIGPTVWAQGDCTRDAGGISDSTWYTFATIPEGFRPSHFLRLPVGGYASNSAFATPGFDLNSTGAFRVARVRGPEGVATATSFYVAHSWLAAT